MSLVKSVARVAGSQVRQFGTTAQVGSKGPVTFSPINSKYSARQKLFQAENDLPVHLKGGFSDMILMRITWALGLVGFGWSMTYIIKSAYKEFE